MSPPYVCIICWASGRPNIESSTNDPVSIRWEACRNNGVPVLVYELSRYTLPSVVSTAADGADAVASSVGSPTSPSSSTNTFALDAFILGGNESFTVDTEEIDRLPWEVCFVTTGRVVRYRTAAPVLYQATITERQEGVALRQVYRVRARSVVGWSAYSELSTIFALKTSSEN